MRQIVIALLALLIALPASAKGGKVLPSKAEQTRLENAAPSAEILIQRFLDALDRKDAAALRHLRATEAEYRTIILPGSVQPGSPRKHYRDDVVRYFWGAMNGKSAGYEKFLLDTAGGHGPTKVKSFSYNRGQTRYADYTAYRQLRLVVEDGAGQEQQIWTGSVAEVDGQYKFISFIRD